MALVRLVWGGVITDHVSAGNAIEEWSCSLSLLTGAAPNVSQILIGCEGPLNTWFSHADTGIDSRCAMTWIKCNEFDVQTGLQVTDPTVMVEYAITAKRGGVQPGMLFPTTVSYKVSIDDGTRNPSSRGGFYVPLVGVSIGVTGHYSSANMVKFSTRAQTLINALNAVTGVNVGVWSRKNDAVTASTRVRIGDVPDNISRRRNALPEVYTALPLTL